jgi:hypothetical protein
MIVDLYLRYHYVLILLILSQDLPLQEQFNLIIFVVLNSGISIASKINLFNFALNQSGVNSYATQQLLFSLLATQSNYSDSVFLRQMTLFKILLTHSNIMTSSNFLTFSHIIMDPIYTIREQNFLIMLEI